MRKSLFIILTSLSLVCQLKAYPIEPIPLRKLINNSDLIVTGFVVKTFSIAAPNELLSLGLKARIKILDQLKGDNNLDTIEVSWSNFMICPAPASYHDSTFVIAFLKGNRSPYSTYGLSYGSKTLPETEIEIYKNRISEVIKILEIQDRDQQYAQTLEWLIKCAENPTTKWEGLYELFPKSKFIEEFSNIQKVKPENILSFRQKERLKTVVFKLDREDHVFAQLALLEMIKIGNEPEVYLFLLNGLKSLHRYEYDLADLFMIGLKYNTKSLRKADKIIAEFRDIKLQDNSEQREKILIEDFLKLVKKQRKKRIYSLKK